MSRKKHKHSVTGYGIEMLVLFGVSAVVYMTLSAFVISFGKVDIYKCTALAVALYIITVGIGYLLIGRFRKLQAANDKLSPNMGKIMFEAVVRMDAPAFICDGDEKLVWFNNAMEDLYSDVDNLYGKNLSELFEVSLDDIRSFLKKNASDSQSDSSSEPYNAGMRLEHNGRIFYAKHNQIKTDENAFSLIMTTEATELETTIDTMKGNENVVMYIMIDNLSEIMQYDSDSYHPSASKVHEVLREWGERANCILKEYERDKYVLITQMRVLDEFISNRFNILDDVRNIHLSDTSLPLTISIGVGAVSGTFEEKDRTARMALELALQRGGDQAVVKTDDNTEYFGGMTSAVQKRTTVKARIQARSLMEAIRKSSNVLVMGHRFADFDAFGSCVGIARFALHCGRRVNIISDLNDMNLSGCRALLDTEEEYTGVLIDKNAALDLLDTNTLVVMTDVNNLNIVESREIAERTESLIVIDHHRKTSEYRHEPIFEYIDPSASSASELVAEMLELALPREELTDTDATLMLAVITLDTKNFLRNTGTRTFSSALYLRDRGASPQVVRELSKTSLDDYIREGRFRTNVEFYRKTMAITITEGFGESGPADRITAAKAADNLLDVTGVEASFALVKIDDIVNISARSAGKINVQLILEKLNGGGHFEAAAAQLRGGDLQSAAAQLKDAIDEYMTETMVQT